MRPRSHWRGFWADASAIVAALGEKVADKPWTADFSRQRQQYWWRGYQKQSRFSGTVVALPELVKGGIIVATHSVTHRAISAFGEPAHRIFAVTAAYGVP